jgi:hypothetical protein
VSIYFEQKVTEYVWHSRFSQNHGCIFCFLFVSNRAIYYLMTSRFESCVTRSYTTSGKLLNQIQLPADLASLARQSATLLLSLLTESTLNSEKS